MTWFTELRVDERRSRLRAAIRQEPVDPLPGAHIPHETDQVYDDALNSAAAAAVTSASRCASSVALAADRMREILALPRPQQIAAFEASPSQNSWSLVSALARSCLRTTQVSPHDAVWLGHLAVIAARALSAVTPRLRNALLGACYTQLGNAQRAASMFTEAASALRTAESLLADGLADPTEHGFLLAMQATLLLDRSEFEGALTLVRKAQKVLRDAGDDVLAAQTSAQEANVLGQLGRSEEALQLLDASALTLEGTGQVRLLFAIHANRASYLVDLGRMAEARDSLNRARSLADQIPGRFDRIRLDWIEAQLEAALGNHMAAEQLFGEVCSTFLDAQMSHEFSIATLERALVLALSGKFAEAKQAAGEAMPILQSLGIAPETILAVRLYTESTAAEAAQLLALGELVRKLKRSPGPRA